MSEVLSIKGRIVLDDRVAEGVILVADGRITNVLEGEQATHVRHPLFDFGDCFVLPGLIEVHGHLREPGQTHKEDRLTGTRAAVAGGVTTVLDMPNTVPPTISRRDLENKIRDASGRSYCDYGFIFGGALDNLTELETIDPKLIVGVKFFMAGHETTPTTVANLGVLHAAFEILARRNLLALVHAENQQLIDYLQAQSPEGDAFDGVAYGRTRGEVVAASAVLEAISLAKSTGVRLYLCHLSTPSELDALRWAKRQGLPVFGEVVTYHLLLNTNHYQSLGTLAKVSPPLRDPVQQENLWRSLDEGDIIDTLCSEHTPHTLDEKRMPMRQAASGMPGIQESLPLLLTAFQQRLSHRDLESNLVRLARLTSTHIADIFGLTRKGLIRSGYDADLVIIDGSARWQIRREDLFSKCGWSSYEGWETVMRPVATFVRGQLAYYNGVVVEEPQGRPVWI